MKFRCYEDGRDRGAKVIDATGPDARAMAAAAFCHEAELSGADADIIVEPADDEARALPRWQDDGDGEVFVCIRVTAQRTTTWTAEEVRGFNPYGAHGPVLGGESAEVVS